MNITVFTGAGISRESGLKTFRDSDGLWEGCKVEDICSTQALATNPELVLSFYNDRRREILAASPNAAHLALAELETKHNVTVVTQNIDDLHERGGSTHVIHLHGQIFKKKVSEFGSLVDCESDIELGDIDEYGNQYRPHVVMYGELPWNIELAKKYTKNPDILIVIGSTLQVTPAAQLVKKSKCKKFYIVDPNPPHPSELYGYQRKLNYTHKVATEGVREIVNKLLERE